MTEEPVRTGIHLEDEAILLMGKIVEMITGTAPEPSEILALIGIAGPRVTSEDRQRFHDFIEAQNDSFEVSGMKMTLHKVGLKQ